ncbi:hypothetical protein B0H10DRAFT_2027298 [Mycena sp. CBHHK59/15]|nr:hypothetical protein B0H10DRAFT_2027298 [Mycena sp. CBHHK59/15]
MGVLDSLMVVLGGSASEKIDTPRLLGCRVCVASGGRGYSSSWDAFGLAYPRTVISGSYSTLASSSMSPPFEK